jgi:hypothetical protein
MGLRVPRFAAPTLSFLNSGQALKATKQMSELPRKIVSRLRRFIRNRRRARRARVELKFTLQVGDPRTSSNGSRRLPSLDGHTLDISTTGMALIVPAIRIGQYYLAGTDRRLNVKLNLPSGPVEMQLLPVRYESLVEDDLKNGYVIGARIIEMDKTDRAKFDAYVAGLLNGRVSLT